MKASGKTISCAPAAAASAIRPQALARLASLSKGTDPACTTAARTDIASRYNHSNLYVPARLEGPRHPHCAHGGTGYEHPADSRHDAGGGDYACERRGAAALGGYGGGAAGGEIGRAPSWRTGDDPLYSEGTRAVPVGRP